MRYAHIQSQPLQDAASAADGRPASPCISVCQLDRREVCCGCGRTLAEIAAWGRMSAREQWAVIERLHASGERK